MLVPWLAARGCPLQTVRLYAGERIPPPARYDWLIVLGGPMGADDHDEHPWLAAEKAALTESLDAGHRVLGICLGAQLLAQALGAKVGRSPEAEIGWFDVELTEAGRGHRWCAELPPRFPAFHWHHDRFDLPSGALRLARSQACPEQAFVWDDRVLGLQFHLETTPEDVACWIERNPPHRGRYVQGAEQMLGAVQHFADNRRWLAAVLERFVTG